MFTMKLGPLTTRLPAWLDGELRRFFSERGLGPSEGMRQIVDEWWTMEHFPSIEFREGPAGRRAATRSGPDVWEIVMVWRDYGSDLDRLKKHYHWISPGAIDEALAYYERYTDTIDDVIAENDRLLRLIERS
jgi:uncharacterized protein (DUF433 family)